MTLPKKGRRTISVDGDDFHWVVQFERSGHVVIQHASGRGACLIIEPLDIMHPVHIADAIRFAVRAGWSPAQPGPSFWLGFQLALGNSRYIQIPANSESWWNDSLKRWELPTPVDADCEP